MNKAAHRLAAGPTRAAKATPVPAWRRLRSQILAVKDRFFGSSRQTAARLIQGGSFKLLRYFSFCSAVLLGCITVSFAFGYNWQQTNAVMTAAEQHNIAAASSLASIASGRYASYLESLKPSPIAERRTRNANSDMDRELRKVSQSFGLTRFRIFSVDGAALYASDFIYSPVPRGWSKHLNTFLASSKQQSWSFPFERERTSAGWPEVGTGMASLVPLTGDDNRLIAILAVDTDITAFMAKVRRDVLIATLLGMLACSLLFSVLFLIVARAERVIGIQTAELLRALAAAKKAEDDSRTFAEMLTDRNVELAESLRRLKLVQDESIKRGKLAQLGQLTATVAHEMRNPLGAVRTAAYLLERKIEGSGLNVDKQIERINSGIRRCDLIISELLDFARSKALTLKTVAVDEWIARTIEEEAKSLPPSIAITIEQGIGSGAVAFDADRMRRVLVNLLSNAAEAMVGKGKEMLSNPTANPEINVSSRLIDGRIEIIVQDNGPGISQENMKKILDPLFTTKSFGVGLGLPAVEKILEQHGGGLRIESNPGEGATFTAWFPALSGDELTRAA